MSDFIWTVLASSATTSLLIAALIFLCKSQLTHWVNKDLEATKNRYARELESHKLSLMGDAERIKAAQDVKKASALWVLERRYKSYIEALDSVVSLGFRVSSAAVLDSEFKSLQSFTTAKDHILEFRRASLAVAPFVSPSEVNQLDQMYALCLPILPRCVPGTPALTDDDKKRLVDPLFETGKDLEVVLFKKIEELSAI